ncbi:MAG: hemerythrin family protein [Planctomycetes bacterium]|nr:hemerythrin family protein [Planctomycetota bacterium]
MLFVWDKGLEIGNDEIDNQHKEIFKRVNKLLSAMADGRGKETIGNLIAFLTEYVAIHFNAEEALMRKHSYTDYLQHQMQHKQFTGDVLRLKQGTKVTIHVAYFPFARLHFLRVLCGKLIRVQHLNP